MKTSLFSDLFEVLLYYIKFLVFVVGNIVVWIGLDSISKFENRGIFTSGMTITSLMWILAVFLMEIKKKNM